MSTPAVIREPAVAGSFYSARPETLRAEVTDLLEKARIKEKVASSAIAGAVVPHAGYMYSGPTAAYAYAALGTRPFGTAVIVGPSHREYFTANAVYDGDAFRTPLGLVQVDEDLREALLAAEHRLLPSDRGHRLEHAIEVQLPFLQVAVPGAKILPITMGVQDHLRREELAACLSAVLIGRDVVVIASSDLSHYHPYAKAVALDAFARERIASMDLDGFATALDTDRLEACGGGPVWVAMRTCKELGARFASVLHACNSGDVTGDHSAVVGYLSAVFTKL